MEDSRGCSSNNKYIAKRDPQNNSLLSIITGLQKTIEEQQKTINILTNEIRQLREELSQKK